jgi:hypothetical protein
MPELFSFDQGDLGKIMPEAKSFLAPGKVIIVWGVSEATVDNGEFDKPARSLFWNLPTDERAFEGDNYWGLLLSEDALPIRDTQKMVERNRVPFAAHISLRPKVNSKGQSYWVMKRFDLQYNADGSVHDPNAENVGKK